MKVKITGVIIGQRKIEHIINSTTIPEAVVYFKYYLLPYTYKSEEINLMTDLEAKKHE